MKRLWMSGAAAVMAMSIASVGAQTPQTPPPTQTPQTQPPASSMQEPATTLTGCVYKEADVPGRTPNVAEKAGVMEDYILVTTAASASGTAGTTGTTPPATAGTAGTASAAGKAYKLEQIADERLQAVVGKRVEVTGRVDKGGSAAAGAKPTPDTNPGSPDAIELPEFEVTSIKEVEGTCPATPEIKK